MLKRFVFYTILVWTGFCHNLPNGYAQTFGEIPENVSYHWGRGLLIPQANLNLGGYVHTSFSDLEQKSAHFGLDDLSLFISWSPFSQLHFFSEIELEDWMSTSGVEGINQALTLERYYFDFLASESLSLRVGKFLTPVGRWNTVHAAPLIWTTSRPLISEDQLFASHVSGAMLTSNLLFQDHNFEFSVYIDDSEDLEPRTNDPFFNHAVGVRLNYEASNQLEIGASYLAYKKHTNYIKDESHLFGLDMSWKNQGYEVQFEMSYRHANDQDNEKGLYLQGVAPIYGQLFAVSRYEYLSGRHLLDAEPLDSTLHLGITGLAWRPYSPMVLKAEYRFGSNNNAIAPSGFFASISMFF
jgi:hypothetical protein